MTCIHIFFAYIFHLTHWVLLVRISYISIHRNIFSSRYISSIESQREASRLYELFALIFGKPFQSHIFLNIALIKQNSSYKSLLNGNIINTCPTLPAHCTLYISTMYIRENTFFSVKKYLENCSFLRRPFRDFRVNSFLETGAQ